MALNLEEGEDLSPEDEVDLKGVAVVEVDLRGEAVEVDLKVEAVEAALRAEAGVDSKDVEGVALTVEAVVVHQHPETDLVELHLNAWEVHLYQMTQPLSVAVMKGLKAVMAMALLPGKEANINFALVFAFMLGFFIHVVI